MRTPRNFLMRAERKALSPFALRKTQRKQIRQKAQKLRGYKTQFSRLPTTENPSKENNITAQLRQYPSFHISS